MSDIHIQVSGDLRPDWLRRLEEVLREAAAEGWTPTRAVEMEAVYIVNEKPRRATWTIGDSR